jgi:hypothetical protein
VGELQRAATTVVRAACLLLRARGQPDLYVKTRLRAPRPRPLAAKRNTTCPQRGMATLPGERAARLANSRVRGLSRGPSRIIRARP